MLFPFSFCVFVIRNTSRKGTGMAKNATFATNKKKERRFRSDLEDFGLFAFFVQF